MSECPRCKIAEDVAAKLSHARAIITQAFTDGNQECRSCGWMGCEYEHAITDEDIQDALAGDGVLRLSCVSKDGCEGNRGVKIQLRGADK